MRPIYIENCDGTKTNGFNSKGGFNFKWSLLRNFTVLVFLVILWLTSCTSIDVDDIRQTVMKEILAYLTKINLVYFLNA